MLDRKLFINGDKIIQKSSQDVEPIIERNKWLYEHTDGYNEARDLKHVASIPLVVIEDWKNTLGLNFFNPEDRPKCMLLLDLPEWQYLRTSKGRIN